MSDPEPSDVVAGAVDWKNSRIVYAEPEAGLPHALRESIATRILSMPVTAREFELRLSGATYEQIAREGGGILSTVAATRGATEEMLLQKTLPRLDALIAEGAITMEVKSGYGPDRDTEARQLRGARRLRRKR